MTIEVEVQYAAEDPAIPGREEILSWVHAALDGGRVDAELTVRIVDEAEMVALNRRYRHKQGPTNVLSFSYEPVADVGVPLLGDIVVCAPVVEREAREQDKAPRAHWAHMVVHGTLHLLGHDHVESSEAAIMEGLEIAILRRLGYRNPYLGEGD